MYQTSSEFHQAIMDGNEQMPLLIFENAVFTASDLNVDKGITFNDYFNLEDDLSIGQALSNELAFSVFNDNGYLNDYEFGEFMAWLGVLISTDEYTPQGTIEIQAGNNLYVANSTSPYMTRNSTALSTQPSGELANILVYDGKVYCFQKSGAAVVYDDSDGSVVQVTVPEFMVQKFKAPTMYGAFFNSSTRILTINAGGTAYTYEFVPLGHFVADRPNVPTVNEIDFNCNDLMMKFEKDMPDDTTLELTYPLAISTLLDKMCSYVGGTNGVGSFINDSATISSRPEEFNSATMRDVLKWIAEAAGGNIKFNRNGELKIKWLQQTQQAYGPNMYKTFNPYWYETSTVTQLKNRASDGSYDNSSGSGDEIYLIQDNPLLRGVE